jgi:hypothetical protein
MALKVSINMERVDKNGMIKLNILDSLEMENNRVLERFNI